jgi:glycine betaine catabolism A
LATTYEAPQRQLLPTVDRSWYIDPERFESERRAIHARRWMLVGRSTELDRPGSYVTRSVAGESVIVVRQADGGVCAMLNVCRHRRARILLGSDGVCERAIRCPYHAWSYGLDGALTGAPSLRDWIGDRQDSLGLQRVAMQERYGCLWVNLALDGITFDDDVGAQIRHRLGDDATIDAWQLERLVTGRRIVYDIAANWKLLVENFMECYHCTTIHPELVAVIPEFRGGLGSQSHGPGYGAVLGEGAGFTVDGRPGLTPLPQLSEDQQGRYFGMTITPNVFLNLVGDHAIIHRLEPVAVNRTVLTCDWLFPEATLADNADNADIDPTVELFDRVNRQDFEACERCQLGAESRVYAHTGVLVPVEHHLEEFYAEVRAAVLDR